MGSSERRWRLALLALLFLTVCAYLGAALWSALSPTLHSAPAQEDAGPLLLEGIALRRERALEVAVSGVEDGARLPAGTQLGSWTAPYSVLYYAGCDGLESLTPDAAASWDVPALRAVLNAPLPAIAAGNGRAVAGFDWAWAALCPAEAAPGPGQRCHLRFSGREETVLAWVLSVSAPEEGLCAVLFRLNAGGDYYETLRLCTAELLI